MPFSLVHLYRPIVSKPIRDRVELLVDDMRMIDPTLLDDVDAVVNVGGLSNDPTASTTPRPTSR
jgi:hypothetical protein